MATAPVKKKKTTSKKRARPTTAKQEATDQKLATKPEKNAFEKKFGEGTAFDLDYGKLLIIGLCVYIAVQVS
tara:strand:+ start:342 stop:557 length:216 start_codon:yes stop_codon:yes gene_type:complete